MSRTVCRAYQANLFSTIIVASLAVVFAIVVITGIWMGHVYGNGDLTLANNLRVVHLVSGILFIIFGSIHMWNYRYEILKIFQEMPHTWRIQAQQLVLPLFAAAFICTAISSVLIICGMTSAISFHCGVALLFSVIAIFHMVINMGTKEF